MGKVNDVRATPGEAVLPRSPERTIVRVGPDDSSQLVTAGLGRSAVGLVVSTAERGWTYVLWSSPVMVGWSLDGSLRRMNQRG